MSGNGRKLIWLAAGIAVIALAAWLLRGGGADGNQWRAGDDAEKIRHELKMWVEWLRRQNPADFSAAIERRLDDSVSPGEREAVVRQTAALLSVIHEPAPVEVVRYGNSEVVRARWKTRNGGEVVMMFRCTDGHPPRVLRGI
jgi:hypothetical protein